jgi:cysteine-rich repeat protein
MRAWMLLGIAVVLPAACNQSQDLGGNTGGGGAAQEDCADSECGAPCLVCSAGEPNCPQSTQGFCNGNLVCQVEQPQCGASACGNGVVEPGEECDDGNTDETDFCTNECGPIVQTCQNAACGTPCIACGPNDPQCTQGKFPGWCSVQQFCEQSIQQCP